jgi:hypothetical protein
MCLLIAGCTEGDRQAAASPSVGSCSVSKLELGPEGFAPYGLARAGPVWLSAFGRVDPGAPATLAGTGPYDGWKVVIHPEGNATRTATLTGVQCSSGKPVRFCYESCDWTTSTGRLKTSSLTLRVDVGQHLDYTGYMVFPGPGLMRFSVSDAKGVYATVVIDVP